LAEAAGDACCRLDMLWHHWQRHLGAKIPAHCQSHSVSKKVAVSSPLALNSTVSIEAQPSLLTKGNATTRSEETELETRTSSVSTNEAVPLPLAALNSTMSIKTRPSQLRTGNATTRFKETELHNDKHHDHILLDSDQSIHHHD
jgi:hypothetical protein